MSISPRSLNEMDFTPFGDVIEARSEQVMDINEGTSKRFHDLALVDVASENGRPLVNIFRASPYPQPLHLTMMEKHPLGSQLFMPLQAHPYLVAVAPRGERVHTADIQVFLARGDQGVNFHPGVWHHPLLVLQQQDFLVIDRGGAGDNLVEQSLETSVSITAESPVA